MVLEFVLRRCWHWPLPFPGKSERAWANNTVTPFSPTCASWVVIYIPWFLGGFQPRNVQTFKFLSYIRVSASYGPRQFWPKFAITFFSLYISLKFQVPGVDLGGYTTWYRGIQLGSQEPGENWAESRVFSKSHVLPCSSRLGAPIHLRVEGRKIS